MNRQYEEFVVVRKVNSKVDESFMDIALNNALFDSKEMLEIYCRTIENYDVMRMEDFIKEINSKASFLEYLKLCKVSVVWILLPNEGWIERIISKFK